MAVRLTGTRDTDLWTDLVQHPLGSLFSSPLWIETLARTYGFEIAASVRAGNGSAPDALLFSRVADVRGERILCLPFSDYCDPLVQDAVAWEELIAPVLAQNVPVSLRCLNAEIPQRDPRFTETGHALWHAVDAGADEDVLWSRLCSSARQNIRRAKRAGVVVREGRDLAAVEVFHRLHCELRKTKYRLLAQPWDFFQNIFDVFSPSDQLAVLIAEIDGRPIAGSFFLEWQDALYYKFNASIEQSLRPNDLLVWEGIRLARRRGLARMDFGLSDLQQPGLVRYKRKFATAEKPIVLLRWQPPGHADPRARQADALLGKITGLLTRPDVPDDVTRAGGDLLYRYFC